MNTNGRIGGTSVTIRSLIAATDLSASTRHVITGRWGKPSEPLLDLTVDERGTVSGIANPGRQNAPIRVGHFDAATGAVRLEGEHTQDGRAIPFVIQGTLDGRTLRLAYTFGAMHGDVALVRVEEYVPPTPTLFQRVKPHIDDFRRWLSSRSRPTGEENRRRLAARGESLDSIVVRDANVCDIPALAQLHVTTWNMTYNTSRGPTVATRARQWTDILTDPLHDDIVVVLEDRGGRLIGFFRAKPTHEAGRGNLSKIYLRWEYHGLGLGRRMMGHVARRFLATGVTSFTLFAERSNPTIGFYDRLGGERMLNDRGEFEGGYRWNDLQALAAECPE